MKICTNELEMFWEFVVQMPKYWNILYDWNKSKPGRRKNAFELKNITLTGKYVGKKSK